MNPRAVARSPPKLILSELLELGFPPDAEVEPVGAVRGA